jgi:hypothetical protein
MSDGTTKAVRDKKWSEMNDQQRIESLQIELVRTQRHLKYLSTYVNKLIEHEHLNGKMVARIGHPNEESYGDFNFRVKDD